jgi:glycosyltransferase involved in cell wall biosynthesis
MTSNHFPNVLFITPVAFNRVTGGGITFSALFRGWPQDNLATIHNDPEPTLDEVCARYYVLGDAELNFSFPFNHLRKASQAGGAVSISAGEDVAQKSSVKSRLVSFAKKFFLRIVGDSLPQKAVLTPELDQWISAYKPDVIYTILGSNGLMDLIEQVRVKYDLPVVTHIMDDWVSASHETGIFAPFARKTMHKWVNHFMAVSKTRLSISPMMSKAYEKRYGHEFEAFQNTIDTQKWLPLAQDKVQVAECIDVLYVGSIFHNAQLQSLINICRAIGELADAGKDISLTISSPSGHTDKYRSQLATHPAIKIEDTIRDDDIFFNRIASADVLLLPVNFDEESVRFIRYSMPTKVPAYLTVGTPILLYAPAGIAQVEYAREDGWGLVVDEQDPEKLKQGLLRLCEDTKLRAGLSETAKNIAQRNHDAKTVRRRFQQVLTEATLTSN